MAALTAMVLPARALSSRSTPAARGLGAPLTVARKSPRSVTVRAAKPVSAQLSDDIAKVGEFGVRNRVEYVEKKHNDARDAN